MIQRASGGLLAYREKQSLFFQALYLANQVFMADSAFVKQQNFKEQNSRAFFNSAQGTVLH